MFCYRFWRCGDGDLISRNSNRFIIGLIHKPNLRPEAVTRRLQLWVGVHDQIHDVSFRFDTLARLDVVAAEVMAVVVIFGAQLCRWMRPEVRIGKLIGAVRLACMTRIWVTLGFSGKWIRANNLHRNGSQWIPVNTIHWIQFTGYNSLDLLSMNSIRHRLDVNSGR